MCLHDVYLGTFIIKTEVFFFFTGKDERREKGGGGGSGETQRERETEICIFFHNEWFPSCTKLIVVMVHCVHGYTYIES